MQAFGSVNSLIMVFFQIIGVLINILIHSFKALTYVLGIQF